MPGDRQQRLNGFKTKTANRQTKMRYDTAFTIRQNRTVVMNTAAYFGMAMHLKCVLAGHELTRPVTELKDMSPEKIREIEQRYNAKVKI